MSLFSSVTGIFFRPAVPEAEPRTFEELVDAEGLTFNDLTPREKKILMDRKGELELDKLRSLKLEEAECAELEETHRTRLQKSSIWNGRRIAVTIAKGTGVMVVGAFAAGAASVSIPVAAGVAVCTGVGYLFYLRTHAGELETRSKQLTDFVVTHAQPQRIIREQLEIRESERAEALNRTLHQTQEELALERQRKAELASQLFPEKSDLASGQEHFQEMQYLIEQLRFAEQRQKELGDELRVLTERHKNVDLETLRVNEEVERLSDALRNWQDTEKGGELQLAREKVMALEGEARTLTEKIKEKDIELERLNRQKSLQANDIQALILQNKAVERGTIKPLQRKLKVAERMLVDAENAQQAIQNQLFQTQQTVRSLEGEVKTVSDEADTRRAHLESALERVQFLENQLSLAIQNKDKNFQEYLVVISELNTVRTQLVSSQELQKELETQLENDQAAQHIQVRRLGADLEKLQKEKALLINSSEKIASENRLYREQVALLTREEQMVRARWVEAHQSTQRLKNVEKELKAQGELLTETRVHLQHEASSRKVLEAELNGFKQWEANVAKEKASLEAQIQRLRDQKKTDQTELVRTAHQLEEKKYELKLLQESHTRLQEHVSQGKLSKQQLRTELDRVREEILNRNREIREISDLLQKTKSALESSEQKVLDLKAEQETVRSQTMQGPVSSAMTHVNQLTADLVNTREQLKKVEEQKYNLELQFQGLSSMNEKLLKEAAQFNNKRGQKKRVWQQQIRQAKYEAEQCQALAKRFQQELISKNSSVDEMSERLKQFEEAFGQVSEELNVKKQEANAVTIQLESTMIESEERRLKLEEVEQSRAKLQFRLDSLTGELEMLRSKPKGVDKEVRQRVVDELAKAQGEVKQLQRLLGGIDTIEEKLQADAQALPKLKDKLNEINEQLMFLEGSLQRVHESVQTKAEEIAQTLSRLKSEWQEMAVMTGQEMVAIKRQVEQLHEMSYLLKVREVESQTRTLETQVKLVEALKTLNELQKGRDSEETDKLAEELVAAETLLQALREESEELSRSLMSMQNHPAVLVDVDPEDRELDRLRSELLLEQQKSEDYASQIRELKVQFVRQSSEMQPSDTPDEEYALTILEVVKKYIALDENEARPGTGLETLLTDPLDYIYRIDDSDDNDRDWETELAGEEAPESWHLALKEEQQRSRAYFKELMAFRTYLVAELGYRGLKTMALEECRVELEGIISDYLGISEELKEISLTNSPVTTTMPSSSRVPPDRLPDLEWDNYGDLRGSSDLSEDAAHSDDGMQYEPTRPESWSSFEDYYENDELGQQRREDHEPEMNDQQELNQKVLSVLGELENIDHELAELGQSEQIAASSIGKETGTDSRRARLEERKAELSAWLLQEDVYTVMQKFR
ncbi:hypothetical protein [Endozoicomonas sp. ONNA1]|uniref:hypothetical protein n=1 Tax=Endozoicomonas sp. ONNA1 TaxID=2828740 RepID=UPI0021488061|nr:hypothetical protein [Endozoicomonas sp. ONNA1]